MVWKEKMVTLPNEYATHLMNASNTHPPLICQPPNVLIRTLISPTATLTSLDSLMPRCKPRPPAFGAFTQASPHPLPPAPDSFLVCPACHLSPSSCSHLQLSLGHLFPAFSKMALVPVSQTPPTSSRCHTAEGEPENPALFKGQRSWISGSGPFYLPTYITDTQQQAFQTEAEIQSKEQLSPHREWISKSGPALVLTDRQLQLGKSPA